MSAREAHIVPARRFSRRWFLAWLRTVGWVTVVTVLVWVYADIQFTEPRDMRATLRIHTASRSDMVLLSPRPPEITIQFRVKGNRHYIDRFADRLAAGGSILLYDAARALESAGSHRERIVDVLEGLNEFRNAGLEIISARPRNIDIELDQLKLLTAVRVEFAYVGGALAEPAKLDPDRINVRVPSSQLKGIDPKKLKVTTETLDLSGMPAGEVIEREVSLVAPPGLIGVQLAQQKVKVTFEILQKTGSRKFKVAVRPLFPNSWLEDDTWSKFRLVAKPPEDWTREITVVGSRIDLERLRLEDIDAYIELTDEDLHRGLESWWPGKIKVRLPAGLNLRLGEPPPADLLYRLTRRTETPGS